MKITPHIRQLIRLALEEDLSGGDITTELCIPKDQFGVGEILARQDLVVCGTALIGAIFSEYGSKAKTEILVREGALVRNNRVLARISAPSRDLLSLERTVLNFLQRFCGVATYTHLVVSKSGSITVLDTRKTLPGYRVLEKYAAKIGGAKNHRASLSNMVLVKNNHVDLNGGDLLKIGQEIKKRKPASIPIEIEVRNLSELNGAIAVRPNIVMLDNMKDAEIRQSLKMIDDSGLKIMVEISGGVSVKRFPALRRLGVKYVSMGALFTQATNVDISMRIKAAKGNVSRRTKR